MAKKINSGSLNQKIEIWRYTSVSDGAGGSEDVDTLYWATSASCRVLSSYEVMQAEQEMLKGGFEFTVRYRVDKSIKVKDVIHYRGGTLNIISAPLDYANKEYITFKAIWGNRPEYAE